MDDNYYGKINLAGLIIDTYIDSSFVNIRNFLDRFADSDLEENKKQKCKVSFSKGNRKIELSDGWDSLSIIGNDIDDLYNPFNLIGITQALFRFAGIHLINKGVFLLHGSTAVLNGKIICFGDDGDSIAKTLGSLEAAFDSKEYVADEFCFFNSENDEIFGYRFIPIHIRPIVKEHLKIHHNFSTPKSLYKNTSAGDFIEQDSLFTTTRGKLTTLAYIHFSDDSSKIQKLSSQTALDAFKFCAISHIAKLLYPNLDRMQFSSMTDASDVKVIDKKLLDEIMGMITHGRETKMLISDRISSYRLTVSQSCQITDLLKEVIS